MISFIQLWIVPGAPRKVIDTRRCNQVNLSKFSALMVLSLYRSLTSFCWLSNSVFSWLKRFLISTEGFKQCTSIMFQPCIKKTFLSFKLWFNTCGVPNIPITSSCISTDQGQLCVVLTDKIQFSDYATLCRFNWKQTWIISRRFGAWGGELTNKREERKHNFARVILTKSPKEGNNWSATDVVGCFSTTRLCNTTRWCATRGGLLRKGKSEMWKNSFRATTKMIPSTSCSSPRRISKWEQRKKSLLQSSESWECRWQNLGEKKRLQRENHQRKDGKERWQPQSSKQRNNLSLHRKRRETKLNVTAAPREERIGVQ